MMQQVATSGSEIAALKGKAEKGAQNDGEQGSAFDAMFQQAKSSSHKSPASGSSSAEAIQAAKTRQEAVNADHAKKAETRNNKQHAEPEAGEGQSGENTKSSNSVSASNAGQDAESVKVKAEAPISDDEIKTTMPVDPETDIPDDGNLVNLDPKEVKMTWDEWLASQKGEVDWLAHIDAVRQAKGDVIEKPVEKGKSGDDGEILPVIPSPVSDSGTTDDVNVVPNEERAAVSGSDIPDEATLQANIAALSEAIVKSVNESDKPKPGDGKQEILPIMPIVEKLTELLTTQNQQQVAGETSQTDVSEKIQALAAQLAGVLKASQESQADTGNLKTTGSGSDAALDIEGLIASFKGETSDSAADNGQHTEAELLLDLIQTEIIAAAKEGTEKAVVTPDVPLQPGVATDTATTAGEEATAMRRLINDMMQLSDEGQNKITQSLADKVVALLPPTASDQQQQTVKQAVIAGVQELQSQLSQGHEPGIDLKAIIADAVKEANIPVTPQMMTQAEQQVSQLQQLLSTAHSAAHQSAAAQVASADTMIQENTQVRNEATKAQNQADSIDKPVNITKAEGLQQLNEKIRWMMSARNMMAEIRLDPPELGSMQVRVNMSGDTASVNFVVQSQQARDALADATPRLRDMLAEQGIELGESFVQQQSSGQGETGENGDGQFAGSGSQSVEEDDMQIVEQPVSRESLGGIDYYA